MKNLVTIAVCSSLLLMTGCNGDTDKAPTTIVEKATVESGIDFANIDKAVRPQDNFYMYVNGGWLNSHTIPADKTAIGSFYDLRDQADNDVKAIIEELAATPDLKMGSDEQKVADLFRSYMDQEKRNSLGTSPIQPIFSAINDIADKDQLAAFFGQYQTAGVGNPLAFYISVDA